MVALFRDYPAAQCALGVIVAGGVALLHVRCRPYRKPLLSSIVLTSELCIALLLLAALQYTAVDQDTSTATDQVVAGAHSPAARRPPAHRVTPRPAFSLPKPAPAQAPPPL